MNPVFMNDQTVRIIFANGKITFSIVAGPMMLFLLLLLFCFVSEGSEDDCLH